ncbi:MAG: hypothetical protein ISR50_03095 [Alphaproteobacteria bacterium]|nr:hypothetical protein [Alphaproteobacteria bacterium]
MLHLAADPSEQNDLGADPAHGEQRALLQEKLFHWLRNRRMRTTLTHEMVEQRTGKAKARGFFFGVW